MLPFLPGRDHRDGSGLAHDLILAGGGLANSLIALELKRAHPDLDILMLEAGERVGGNHTWSFHTTDLSPEAMSALRPALAHSWPEHSVRFPAFERRLSGGYHSISSESLASLVLDRLKDVVRTGIEIAEVGSRHVLTTDGSTIEARAVIDGRGARPSPHLAIAFQKFVGQEIELQAPHGLVGPILMDATVPQIDGYRFVYVLPFGERRVLVEDTRYSDDGALDAGSLREAIADYVERQGWQTAEIHREESGVLPIALAGDIEAYWDEEGGAGAARSGLRAALFHPTTGYSLPDAVRLASELAALPVLDADAVSAATRRHSTAAWESRAFYRLLNRMLFLAARPEERYKVLERFYQLPEPLIERFYACETTFTDQARILVGKPPVPILRALRTIAPSSARRSGRPGVA